MNWFESKKKYIFLLDQDEEVTFSLGSLEKYSEKVGIVYTGDWDIEVMRWHSARMSFCEKLYPHIYIMESMTHTARGSLNEVKKILNEGPIPLSIRALFSASYDNMTAFHDRKFTGHTSYSNMLDKLFFLHKFLMQLPRSDYPDAIVMPEKIGWMRKYISYFFYSKGIPLYGFMGLRHDQKYAIEICADGKLAYFGKKGVKIFSHTPTEQDMALVVVDNYRKNQNETMKRSGGLPLARNCLMHLVRLFSVGKTYALFMAALLIKRQSTFTSFNANWNRFYTPTIFYFTHWIGFWWFLVDAVLFKINFYKKSLKDATSKQYVFLALHHYPETSTVGEYSYIQTEMQFIGEVLDCFDDIDNFIIVDHPTTTFSGERARWIRKFFKNTRGVKYFPLISVGGVPFDILKNAKAVLTIIGGVAIENALLGGKSFISILHPMLFVNNIHLLDIPSNRNLRKYLDIGNISMSAHEYCALTEKFGLVGNEELLYFLEDEFTLRI
jgi:hypothetical protein